MDKMDVWFPSCKEAELQGDRAQNGGSNYQRPVFLPGSYFSCAS